MERTDDNIDVELDLEGGRGQGVLLVDGDLTVRGGVRFYGPVVVTGQLTTTGEGGHFSGAVFAATVVLAQSGVAGGAAVGFSSCALRRAAATTERGDVISHRGWLRLPRLQ